MPRVYDLPFLGQVYESDDLEPVALWLMNDCKRKYSHSQMDLVLPDFREWAWHLLTGDEKVAQSVTAYARQKAQGGTVIVKQHRGSLSMLTITGFDLILPNGKDWAVRGFVTPVVPRE